MHTSRLPWLVLATPLFLCACGDSADDLVQSHERSALRSTVGASSLQDAPAPIRFTGPRDGFNLTRSATGYAVTDRRSGAVLNVTAQDRLRFDDTSIALDLEGAAGQLYRLYRGAFGRSPDIAGLSYWITTMDAGADLNTVAIQYSTSPEFSAAYGNNPGNVDLVNRLYLNVLGRSGEPSGVAYWNNVLDKELLTRAQVLVAFSESAENRNASVPMTRLGVAYTEAGVAYALSPTALGFEYQIQAQAANAAEARVQLNNQGALGYAYLESFYFVGLSEAATWRVELYAKSTAGAKYTYEVVPGAYGRWPERMPRFQELGAKGYLYKDSTSIHVWTGIGKAARPESEYHDLFVKTSLVDTTYRYRLDDAPLTEKSLNAQGAQGYFFVKEISSERKDYALYAKDMGSDAVFDYVQADHKGFDEGLMEQINTMGARSYAYLGSTYLRNPRAMFMRSSVYTGAYTYTAAPTGAANAQAGAKQLSQHALQGEAYWGLSSGTKSNFAMTIFYKGGWITQPRVGVTFP